MTPPPTIFVQIAAYRDPQLEPTLTDMLRHADHPEHLRFGICRQFHPGDGFDRLDAYRDDARFRILDVLYTRTRGACWARNFVQRLYAGETYTLQIDSHMRFAPGWDTTLIEMLTDLQAAGYPKPLLTAYVPSFDPEHDPEARVLAPWRMGFDRFIPEGAVFFMPEIIPGWESLTLPVPARFYSAHMTFTIGAFSVEVQHNPEYYFHGEEISIGVRAYTHGYDLFHPHRCVIWHEYTRKGRTKQWEDDESWVDRNNRSHFTNRQLFGMDGVAQVGHDGPYGFGESRTLADFEAYAGMRFADRRVQRYTLDGHAAPNPAPETFESPEAYEASFTKVFKHCIDLHRDRVPRDDYDFWVVAFHGPDGETLYRQDSNAEEVAHLKSGEDSNIQVWREFMTEAQPAYWVILPHTSADGWQEQIRGELTPVSYA